MPNYKTSVIILRTYDFKDYDKVVVLYSRERGLIRAVAKGVKRPKSNLGTRIEPLLAAELLMFEGRNLDVINQSDYIESFSNLRKNLKKITYGLYYAELLMAFGVEHDPNSEVIYQYIFDSLSRLNNAEENDVLELLLVFFELKIITFAGYAPMLDYCSNCREKKTLADKVYFNTKLGIIVCGNCAGKRAGLVELDVNIYKLLLEIVGDSVSLSNVDLATVTKAHLLLCEYIAQKTNYNLKTPKLLETLCLS